MASSFKYPTGAHYLQITGQRSIPPASVHTSLIKCIDPCSHTAAHTHTSAHTHTHTNWCLCTILVLLPKKLADKKGCFNPQGPPLLLPPCAHAHTTHTHALTSYLCWDGAEKVSKYIKLLCPLGLLRVNSLQLRPASALEVARLSVRAPADPYQPLLLFNSLHIHDTSTYSSCKMQMPLSFSSQRTQCALLISAWFFLTAPPN